MEESHLFDAASEKYYKADILKSGVHITLELDAGYYYLYFISHKYGKTFETAGYMDIEKENYMPRYRIIDSEDLPFDDEWPHNDNWIDWNPLKDA